MADQTIPPLPPGFELERPPLEITIPGGKPVARDIPPPPPGFVIQDTPLAETPAASSAAAPAAGNSIGRGLGMSARSVLQGAGSLLGAIGGDAVNHYVVNPLARALGAKEVLPYRDEAAALADKIGLPTPQNSQDRIYNDIGEALTGTGLTLGLGGLLNAGRTAVTAPSIRTAAADLLASQPGLQVASAVTGAGTGALARENGAGQGGQLAAALAGGLAPSAVVSGIPAALRGALRGGEANRKSLEDAIRDFDSVGATPSVGQGTGAWSKQGLENLLASGPTSAGVMTRFGEQQSDQIREGLRGVADKLFRNPSAERAGRAIEQGIRGDDGFIQTSRERANQLYQRLDQLIPKDSRVSVDNVKQTLAALNADIPGAPNVSKLFRNARINGIEKALDADLAIPTGEQQSLDEALANLDRLYASRDSATQDAGKFATFANDQSNLIDKFYPAEGQPRISGRYSPSVQRAEEGTTAAEEATGISRARASKARELESTIDQLQAAAEASGGKLPYEAVQKLRTLVGNELESNSLVSDVPRSKWKAVYGGLSKDMEASATTPEAKQALSRANAYFNARASRIDAIDRVIDRNGGPEKIYSAVMGGVKDGGTTLRAVMQSLPEEGQKAVTAAAIRRMGMASPSAQDAAGEAFSASTFLTNWSKASPEARKTLFDRYGPGFSKDMDKIAKVAERIKGGTKAISNPSGTARQGAAFTYFGSLGGALVTGNVPLAATIGGGGVAANVLARSMTSPRVVKWLARSTDLPLSALPAQITVLKRLAAEHKDQAASDLATALEQGAQQQSNASDDNADNPKK